MLIKKRFFSKKYLSEPDLSALIERLRGKSYGNKAAACHSDFTKRRVSIKDFISLKLSDDTK